MHATACPNCGTRIDPGMIVCPECDMVLLDDIPTKPVFEDEHDADLWTRFGMKLA